MRCAFFATMAVGLFLLQETALAGQAILIKKQDCVSLTRHVPEEDVTYRPGVDVKGRKVPPADLENNRAFDVLPEISFYLVLDTAKELDNALYARHPGLKQEMILGYVEVRDGLAYFNGKPIAPAYYAQIHRLCAEGEAEKLELPLKR